MASGHTDRATINARKPMTPGMRSLLGFLIEKGKYPGYRLDGGERSRARALMDRRYAMPDPAGWWTVTDEGKAAYNGD